MSLYHEKALVESAFYGLPMYRVTVPSPETPTGAVNASVLSPQPAGVSGLWAVGVTVQPALTRRDTANGSYYSVGGEVWAGPGRPIQPRATVPVTGPAGTIAHGALLVAGSYGVESGFDPLIARPITDVVLPEPDFDATGWFPAKPFLVNRFGDRDRLVVVPGQYRQQGGVERLYNDLELLVYYSEDSNEDFLPPIIWDVQVEWMTDTLHFEATVSDDGGVHRVVIAYEEDGERWRTMDLVRGAVSNLWLGELGVPSHRLNYFVQAVDGVGNVALGANKGLMFEVRPNMLFLPVVFKGG